MKKIVLLFIYLVGFSITLMAQNESEQKKIALLVTDSIWTKEIFHFPIRFAPELNYKGIEEAQFPIGWSKKESPNFWSYVFVWDIEGNSVNSVKELEADLKTYFDGLMNSQNTSTHFTIKEYSNTSISYVGKVSFFDNLRTKTNISLNVRVTKQYCLENNKTIIVFRFSPQEFENEVWNTIERVRLRDDICNQ